MSTLTKKTKEYLPLILCLLSMMLAFYVFKYNSVPTCKLHSIDSIADSVNKQIKESLNDLKHQASDEGHLKDFVVATAQRVRLSGFTANSKGKYISNNGMFIFRPFPTSIAIDIINISNQDSKETLMTVLSFLCPELMRELKGELASALIDIKQQEASYVMDKNSDKQFFYSYRKVFGDKSKCALAVSRVRKSGDICFSFGAMPELKN